MKKRHESFSDTFMDCYLKKNREYAKLNSHAHICGYILGTKYISNWLAINIVGLAIIILVLRTTEYIYGVFSWWRHQMEAFSALLAICAGNSPVRARWIPLTKASERSFDVSFDLRLKNGWVNNRKVGDLRCHRTHYDVSVMCKSF